MLYNIIPISKSVNISWINDKTLDQAINSNDKNEIFLLQTKLWLKYEDNNYPNKYRNISTISKIDATSPCRNEVYSEPGYSTVLVTISCVPFMPHRLGNLEPIQDTFRPISKSWLISVSISEWINILVVQAVHTSFDLAKKKRVPRIYIINPLMHSSGNWCVKLHVSHVINLSYIDRRSIWGNYENHFLHVNSHSFA